MRCNKPGTPFIQHENYSNGFVMAVPNKHSITFEHFDVNHIKLIAEQNETRLIFILPRKVALQFAEDLKREAQGKVALS